MYVNQKIEQADWRTVFPAGRLLGTKPTEDYTLMT